ncbi:MAG: hypothetical protein JJU05_03200 [Verrucomicrobia bacterium]|nr:hypothetical protein [Verrucomicrobiota bacterium]MCH8528437.1 hypothetical protein [Kiritimatiellia bacterium]
MITLEKTRYKGWENCLRLANESVELIITTDVGPRIISYALKGGKNVFKNYEEMMGVTSGEEWMIFGGHRLWHAPEDAVRTYALDFDPVVYDWDGKTLILRPKEEADTGIRKEMEIQLAETGPGVRVVHRLYNHNVWDVELAPWCLSVMDRGARAIAPQEPFGTHPEHLLPARPLVLWRFTDMADPRWTWGSRYLELRQDPERDAPQKVGFFNSLGWVACEVNDALFVVKYAVHPNAPHADMGANTELFTNGDMLEVETLGALTRIAPGGNAEHTEHWGLFPAGVGSGADTLDANLLPRIAEVPDVV